MPPDAPLAVGIDLGTTNSAVAILEAGGVRVLENRLGEPLTPSVVAVDRKSDALLLGRPARELYAIDPERAAVAFKRGMGRDDVYRLARRELGAVELSAFLLRGLREEACRALGAEVAHCVITVPAYFDEEQRYATIKAGELAGFEVLRILNEPTAAAMAHGLHRRDEDSHFLVFDLGGGTFDVCVMERFAGTLQVKSTAGESHLGGEDFTRRLVGLVLAEIGLSFERVEARDPAAIGQLIKRCELGKRRLSSEEAVEIAIPPIQGILGENTPFELHRAMAEATWKPLLERLRSPCRAALRGARLDPRALDEVILVGGATRMPAVQALVRELFGDEPRGEIDADLAVVHGAAIQAALCRRDEAVEDLVVTDVLSHSLGVEVTKEIGGRLQPGYFSPVIHRNTVIPTTRMDSFGTLKPNQTKMNLRIFEGESRRVEENRLIGLLKVKGIPKGPPGTLIEVRFTYDVNGVLEVEASIAATGQSFSKIFTRDSQSLSTEELEHARVRIGKLKEDPRDAPRIRDLLLRAESLWSELPPEQRAIMEHAIDELESQIEVRDVEQIRAACKVLEEICDHFDGGERW